MTKSLRKCDALGRSSPTTFGLLDLLVVSAVMGITMEGRKEFCRSEETYSFCYNKIDGTVIT